MPCKANFWSLGTAPAQWGVEWCRAKGEELLWDRQWVKMRQKEAQPSQEAGTYVPASSEVLTGRSKHVGGLSQSFSSDSAIYAACKAQMKICWQAPSIYGHNTSMSRKCEDWQVLLKVWGIFCPASVVATEQGKCWWSAVFFKDMQYI